MGERDDQKAPDRDHEAAEIFVTRRRSPWAQQSFNRRGATRRMPKKAY